MKKPNMIATLVSILVLTASVADAAKKAPAAAGPTTDDEKTLYALGLLVSQTLRTFDLKPEELAMVQKGIGDGAKGVKPPLVDATAYVPKVQALQAARITAASAALLTKAAAEPGATKTASGIVIRHTQVGAGASPAETDTVKVNYEG